MGTSGSKRTGVILGGSGLIGGTLMYYFKTRMPVEMEILAPNSKKLSLRVPGDINQYFTNVRPDFIVNAAIAAIDSDPQMAFEVNYLGTVNLARKALELGVPYIHISSAAILPPGENLTEDDQLPLSADLSNYAKSKLMAEMTLKHMHEKEGLDYSIIRLAVVYGKHDHKIQGFHRLFFSIADQSMPVLLTRRGVMHSYSNSSKLPYFIHHILDNREEFSGETYNFVDSSPVELAQIILTIKAYMEMSVPKEIYLPYPVAKAGRKIIDLLIRGLAKIGIEARMPGELMFLENFYKTQTLSAEKLNRSSYVDPAPEKTVFTQLPDLIQYYTTRWEQLNLIEPINREFFDPRKCADEFLRSPEELIEAIHTGKVDPAANGFDVCKQAGASIESSKGVS
ncbi:MAG: SDR family oxidoreductase [Proteobacteria bacterium]|nr:SDR family oxidoreductase [Pseudomonadota bacterium]